MMKQARRHPRLRLVPMLRLVLPQAELQLSRPQAQQVSQEARVSQEAPQAQLQQPQKLQLSAVDSALLQAR